MLYGKIGGTFVWNLHLESLILEGSGLQLPTIGGVKETQWQTPQKNGGGSLAAGSYLQRGSASPPPPPRGDCFFRGICPKQNGRPPILCHLSPSKKYPNARANEGLDSNAS